MWTCGTCQNLFTEDSLTYCEVSWGRISLVLVLCSCPAKLVGDISENIKIKIGFEEDLWSA